jgi:hypothetical protein
MKSSRGSSVLTILFVLSPVLLPLALVAVGVVAFFVVAVVQAFEAGFASGCAALAAIIGVPSVVVLWFVKAAEVFGFAPRRVAPAPTHVVPFDDDEAEWNHRHHW